MTDELSFEDLFEELTGKKLVGADAWFAKEFNENMPVEKNTGDTQKGDM